MVSHALRQIWEYRLSLVLILTPLLLLPLPLAAPGKESLCGYVILLMAIYWITEALPLAVTAFIPLVLFPMLGIMTAKAVSKAYFNHIIWLFVGGLTIAVAVEDVGLHRRIALRALLFFGTKPRKFNRARRHISDQLELYLTAGVSSLTQLIEGYFTSLMFSFMLTTFVLSMWISNTATTAMMLPIVEAVFQELKRDKELKDERTDADEREENPKSGYHGTSFYIYTSLHEDFDPSKYESDFSGKDVMNAIEEKITYENRMQDVTNTNETIDKKNEETETSQKMNRLIKGITLCIPYSASIGGTATLTGTAPNLALAGQFIALFPNTTQSITFGSWIAYAFPEALTMLLMAYVWLAWFYIGIDYKEIISGLKWNRKNPAELRAQNVLKQEYKKLGSMRWAETCVLFLFILTSLFWFFRKPGFISGWSVLFPDGYITDGTVAMAVAILLFVLPRERPGFLYRSESHRVEIIKSEKALLEWSTMHRMFPWSVVFLVAGGFALANGAVVSGFSIWMGQQLKFLNGIEPWAICLVVTIFACLFTECSSNTATALLLVPILSQLALVIEVHPLYLLIAPVIASSMAFMLPVATPPNAIAFSYGHIKVLDMIKAGWMLNIMAIVVITFYINTYGKALFSLDTFPSWAEQSGARKAALTDSMRLSQLQIMIDLINI